MILRKGTKVMVMAPEGYPDVPPAPGTIVDTPHGVFAQMGGMYKVADEDGQVWDIHRDYIKEAR